MRADRLLAILLHLQERGRTTASELAEKLEVSERTARRDLEALCAGGIPLYALRGAGGGWVLTEGYRSKLTGLTGGEIRALLALQASSVVRDLSLGGEAGTAMAKLLSALPNDRRAEAEFVRRRLHVDGAGWHEPERPSPWLAVVQQAVWEERQLRFLYTSSQGDDRSAREKLVCPWGLVAKRHVWYFAAVEAATPSADGETSATGGESDRESDRESDGVIPSPFTYRVDRIVNAEVTERRFEVPPDFDLAAWWERSTRRFKEALPRYPAVVRVTDDAWRRFERERYAVVRDARPAGTAGWVEADVEFHTLESARDLLLAYGDAAIALEPSELREAVVRTALAIAEAYRQG